MSSELLASVDGAITPTAQATIGVADEGLLRGDGVFEVVRVYRGQAFAWEEHARRMARSAGNLRLEIDLGAVGAEVRALLAAAPDFDGQLRVLVTRGGRRIALLEEVKAFSATTTLASVEYVPTRLLDQIKSLSYGANMLASRLAREAGAEEALLVTPHGRVLEAPTSSFFYALGGALHTPPLDDHILDSITRRYVIELTGATERITTTDDLAVLDEAFLASTTRELQAIARIDARVLPAAPGPLTVAAVDAFGARVSHELGAS